MSEIVPIEVIERKIYLIRGQKVMLDSDLAELYGVTSKRLNEQVKRNPKRFPLDFMFQLTEEEFGSLRSHFATIKQGRGQHRKYLPYGFTEQGVSMLSSVLNSERAIEVNVTQEEHHALKTGSSKQNFEPNIALHRTGFYK